MKTLLRRLGPAFIIFTAGGLLVAAGAWMIYPPAGLIALGGIMVLDVAGGRIADHQIKRASLQRKEGES